jgi:hypothetical protein
MESNIKIVPVEVYTGILWEAEMVKNILENEGIEAFVNDEFIGTIAPFYITPGLGSVKVVVSNLDFDKAKLVVAEFEKDRCK